MLQSHIQAEEWTLSCDDQLLLSHSREQPFATAVRREKVYIMRRGTVREQIRERERTVIGRDAFRICPPAAV